MTRRHSLIASWLLFNACKAQEVKCGIYLAPSSIPHSGLGMYAGNRSFQVNDVVTLGDTVIPIAEFEWNNLGGEFEGATFLWDEYTWNSNVFPGMDEEGDSPDLVMVASPGVGAAANSYLSLVNLEDSWIKLGRSVRGESPGVGAGSLYYGREFLATEEIPAGAELFVSYGTNYFKSRPSVYGHIPLPDTFKLTDRLLKRYMKLKAFVNKGATERQRQPFSTEFWEGCYDIMKGFGDTWESSRVLNGLPSDEDILATLMTDGGSARKDYNRSIRDLAWLEENGQCMDNIKVGNSTNPDAGRGAFANRFIPQGGLVAPAPLVHVADYNMFQMFRPMASEPGKVIPNRDGPSTFQLLLNYCFGHEESTLLLCPYGLLTAFINHSPDKPNAVVRWSKEMRRPEWREMPIQRWAKEEYHTGLQIDFVALQDIQEGEEILIDYGKAWEEAWQEHVRSFVPRKDYIPAFVLNERLDHEYRTIKDVEYEVNDIQLWCRKWYINYFLQSQYTEDAICRVLKKTGEDQYMVRIYEVHYSDSESLTTVTGKEVLWKVPSDALYFADLPYTRDHLQFDAFRSRMMIPDEIFPTVWRNLRETDSDLKN